MLPEWMEPYQHFQHLMLWLLKMLLLLLRRHLFQQSRVHHYPFPQLRHHLPSFQSSKLLSNPLVGVLFEKNKQQHF